MNIKEQELFTSTPYEGNERKIVFKIAPTFGVILDRPSKFDLGSVKMNWKVKPGRKSIVRTSEEIENRPLCSCGFNRVAISKHRVRGEEKVYLRKYCHTCADRNYKRASRTFVISKNQCSKCGFKPEVDSQMDYDHIDGDHANNDPSNIQVLCSNCHRLKTYVNRDSANTKFKNGAYKERN